MHTHNAHVAANQPLPERLRVNDGSVIHMASTFAHLTGLLYGVRLPTQVGATAVYQDVWNNERFVELFEQHQITYTSAATPFLHDTLNSPSIDRHDVSSLVRFCCMGAPAPPAIVRQAKLRWPEMAVLGGWGQTENGLVTLGVPGDPDEKIIERDGYPWPGMQLRIVDADGSELGPDQDGMLQVTAPLPVRRVRQSPGDDQRVPHRRLFQHGRSRASRRGRLPEDHQPDQGCDHPRRREHPGRVCGERALRESQDRRRRGGGIPDPRLQERACAWVVLRSNALEFTFPEMQRFLRDKGMAPQYWPERLEVMAELPSTASGKIQKYRLRDATGGVS